MGMDMLQALQQFVAGAQQQHGPNFDPSTVCKSTLGNDCATPQQALLKMFQSGRINKAQYEVFSKMLNT